MKQTLLKLGILLFSFTLIIDNHINNSTYYYIKSFDIGSLTYKVRDEKLDLKNIHALIPQREYITKEVYYNNLNANSAVFQMKIIKSTEKKVMFFKNTQSLFINISLILGLCLIMLALDFKDIKFNKKEILSFQ